MTSSASAFFVSPFEEAACLTVDGFGDFVSSLSAVGNRVMVEPRAGRSIVGLGAGPVGKRLYFDR